MRSSNGQSGSSIQRRSSSADNLALSQNGNRPSYSRASSIGRPSMGASKIGDAKPVNPQELANFILLSLENFNYQEQMTAKALLLPSTATFYNIFEVLSFF